MHKLNPAYKFITLFIVSICLSFTFSIKLNLLVFALCLITTAITPTVNKKTMLLGYIPIIVAAFGLFMSGYLYPAQATATEIQVHATIYVDSLDNALKLSLRILAYGGIGMLFALTTNAMEFIMSLMQQFRLPPKFAYGLLAAYHFFPLIREEYDIVKASLAVRGIKAHPLSRKRVVPMLVHALERSESAAMSMESRGFDNDAPRSVAFPVTLRKVDFVFLFLSVTGVIAGVLYM